MNQLDASQVGTQVADSWKLLESAGELAIESTWEGLEAALLAIPERASSPNSITTLVTPSGDTLSIGIASQHDGDNPELPQPLASVEYSQASDDPPYLVVVGNPALTFENGGVVVFRYGGDWTEVLRRNCVPVDVMLRIVNHFFSTHHLPDWIAWEQV